jgi:hypothetical protein
LAEAQLLLLLFSQVSMGIIVVAVDLDQEGVVVAVPVAWLGIVVDVVIGIIYSKNWDLIFDSIVVAVVEWYVIVVDSVGVHQGWCWWGSVAVSGSIGSEVRIALTKWLFCCA